MYFELTVKERADDFFNYRQELNTLLKRIESERLIVIKGPRRVGKTSLMRVAYNSINIPKVWIDARETKIIPLNVLLFDRFFSLIRQAEPEKRFLDKISSFSIGSIAITLKEESIGNIAERANEVLKRKGLIGVVFIDEAQVLKKQNFDAFLAYIYDNLSNIKVVLAGSQIGLLEEFIGKKSDAYLFGRAKEEIVMKRLGRENSLAFLLQGFEQVGKHVEMDELEDAIRTFDGLIGWLTYYGYYRLKLSHAEAKKAVITQAKEIVKDELLEFLSLQKGKKRRYLTALRAISSGFSTWNDIKNFFIIKENDRITDSRMAGVLERLEYYGFIEKSEGKYVLSDPILRAVLTSAF